MAPKTKPASSGSSKVARATVASQKRPGAAPRGVGKSKARPKRPNYSGMLQKPYEDEEEKVIIGGNSKRPIGLKAPTSFAERNRRRTKLSMAEIFAESSKIEEAPIDHAAEFVAGSTALYTWGAPTTQPVPAVRNERRHRGLIGFGVRRGKGSAFVKFMFGSGTDDGGDDIVVPFRFLDLPLEIRWKIYGYLLIHQKPILMHPDWRRVHAVSPQDHTILRVSKQILLESTQFLYEKNIFQAVINPVEVSSGLERYPTNRFIKKEFLPYIRNVVLDCRFGSLSGVPKDMAGPIATCLSKVVMSEALLDSLTLIINPLMHLTNPSTALVLSFPVVGKSIPQYFKTPTSKVMRIIPKLRCKVLNIIIRMPDRKKVLVSLNLRGLPVNQYKEGWFAEDRVAKLTARKLAQNVKMDLIGLEKRFEDIFDNIEKAIMEGKARLMKEDETLADGMRLASCA